MGLTTELQAEWAAVKGAPILSIAALVVIVGIVWAVLRFLSERQITILKQDLDSERNESARLRGRIAEYQEKAGRTPDEAHAKIEALETRVQSLVPRNLTSAQCDSLATAMKPFEGGHIHIIADGQSHEARNLQQALARVFAIANWNVSQSATDMSYHGVQHTPGLVVSIADPHQPSQAEGALMRELSALGLAYTVTKSMETGIRLLVTARL
jgi:hypothetical protein